MREIEVKLKVNNLPAVKNLFEAKGCVFSSPVTQHDVVYSRGGTSEWEAAKEGDIILRLRNQDGKTEFNLKQQKSSELDNLEYETSITNGEAMKDILRVLGWHPEVEVKKVRQKGKWGAYEICLDDVEQLGTYVELEKMTADDADPVTVQNELLDVMESFGVPREDLEVRGYDTMIFQSRRK